VLTSEQLAFFEQHGYVSKFLICDPDEMLSIRSEIDRLLGQPGFAGPDAHRHLDSRVVYNLCARPEVVERVAAILGPNLLLWHTRFFEKPAKSGPIPWHQDCPFWPIEPDDCVSVWIAIDQADSANACVEVIPGSHRMKVPHIPSEGTGRFGQQANPRFVDESKKVRIELKPGEFFIFDRWLLHGSPPNESDRRRLGLSARIIPPHVRVHHDRMAPTFPELGVQIIRGEDSHRLSRIAPAPPERLHLL
jgi:non-haem Fe2+, alpha-ketoglutarate-dependent halogenase